MNWMKFLMEKHLKPTCMNIATKIGVNMNLQGVHGHKPCKKKSTLNILNQSLDQKVYFAGEINDPYKQMGVPGAILSGYYSIDKLLNDNNDK